MPTFEIRVAVKQFEFYEVEAASAEDALSKYSNTAFIDPVATESIDSEVVDVQELFEDDGIEYDDDFEEED